MLVTNGDLTVGDLVRNGLVAGVGDGDLVTAVLGDVNLGRGGGQRKLLAGAADTDGQGVVNDVDLGLEQSDGGVDSHAVDVRRSGR